MVSEAPRSTAGNSVGAALLPATAAASAGWERSGSGGGGAGADGGGDGDGDGALAGAGAIALDKAAPLAPGAAPPARGQRRWQFLSTSWAIVSDIDIESEVRTTLEIDAGGGAGGPRRRRRRGPCTG